MKVLDDHDDCPPDEAAGIMEPSDGELLMQFVRHRQPEAFAEIVDRHGPMVLGVCMQVLCHRQDAEDAFQATFLVLAGRAHKIQKASSVGAWLHQVAYRTSMRAAKKRGRREHSLDGHEPVAAEPLADIAVQHQQIVLHEELNRLPERYRAPLVLCFLEGRRQQEAADALDCTVAAIQARLTRGKRMLRSRLVRRGMLMAAAFTTAAVGTTTCHAASSASAATLFAGTSQACAAVVLQGSGEAFSATVTSLASQGTIVMTTTTAARVGIAAVLLFSLGTIWFARQGNAQRPLSADDSPPREVLQVEAPSDAQIDQAPVGIEAASEKPVDKVSKALATDVTVEFIETPLDDVGQYLQDLLKVPVVVDASVQATPVTFHLKGVPFAAATQGIEDVHPTVRFVVRDYGILITSSKIADQKKFLSAADHHVGRKGSGPAGTPTLPRGPVVNRLGKAFTKPVALEFIETPLGDIGAFLMDLLDVPIVVDTSVSKKPVTLNLKGVSLAAASQAIEDVCAGTQFVVRDYGLLITSENIAAKRKLMSVADFQSRRKTSAARSQSKE